MPFAVPLATIAPAESTHDAASVGTQSISRIVTAALGPLTPASGLGDAPAASPVLWTLMAFVRRDFDQSASVKVDAGSSVAATPQLATASSVTGPAPLPADNQALYTGQPSLVAQVVELGLRIVDVALKPFGGLLTFTSLEVPIFTDGIPPFFLTYGLDVERSEYEGTPVWTLRPKNPTGQYVVALHGGGYAAQASLFHWWTYTDLARDTGATVVVPLYPLIGEGGTAGVVVPQTADFISQTIQAHGAQNVSVLGDSAGGGIAVAALQELVRRGSPTPARLVLLAPWLDATVNDPRSRAIDPKDPLLDVPNLQRFGREWAGDLDPSNPFASPIYGSFAGLPPTAVFSGSLDLLTPDSLRLRQLADEQGLTNVTFDFRNGLIHDWPIFAFLPDAISIRPEIYGALLGTHPASGAFAAPSRI